MPLLTVIIVSYNSATVIQKYLNGLLSSEKYRTLIVDNASNDGSADRLQQHYPSVEVFALKQNLGYGRAANIGFELAETSYVLLINPDLTASVADIEKLLAHAEKSPSNVAIWGPATVEEEIADSAPQSVDWIRGCAMLFDMKKIREIGFFDENIFLYFEETDLCYRAIAADYQIMRCNDVYFKHPGGQASTPCPALEHMKNWHYGWSRGYFYTKHQLAVGKRNPRRRAWKYRLKSWVSYNTEKRERYRAHADGLLAFVRGVKAFQKDGTPSTMA
jgi:GT2 family glycosyltransferase